MKLILNFIALLGSLKVFFSSTVKNSEAIFLKNYLLEIIKWLGLTNNGSLIFIEGKNVVYSSKTNSGIETIKISEINKNIKIYPNEKIAYVALTYENLLSQLVLQQYFYKFLLKFSIIFGNKKTNSYLRKSIFCSEKIIKKISKLNSKFNESEELSFDKWFLGNIQYTFNKNSVINNLSFKNLFILKSSLGLNSNTQNNFLSKKVNNKINNREEELDPSKNNPKKVFIFYLDNISYYLADNKYFEKDQYPLFAELLEKYKMRNLKFSSTSDWTFPAAISLFSGKKYSDHMIYHRNHRPYYLINDLISNFAEKDNGGIVELKKIYNSFFISGTNWRMHQHHGLSNIFNHLISNPKFSDIYDVISQSYKQIDIAKNDYSLHWINFMDSHHPVKDSVLPTGALKYLNLESIVYGLQYETGPKFDHNLKNKELPKKIYYSQIDSVAKSIDSILSYSYLNTEPKDHLIVFLSDHGSSFCPSAGEYSSTLEKHTPFLSISDNLISEGLFRRIKDKRFSHFGFFKLLVNILNQNLDQISNECLSNFSQIIFPNKPYEFIYFDDKKSVMYKFKSYENMPKDLINHKNKKKKLFYNNSLRKGVWKLIHEKGEFSILENEIPEFVLENFHKVLPFNNQNL